MKKQKESVRLPAHIKPERYRLILRPNFQSFVFEGEETIYFNLQKSSQIIELHAKDLEISEVIYRHAKDHHQAKISYNEKRETVIFSFSKPIPKGQGELDLKFKGFLKDEMRGFYRSRYHVNGEERYLATTQFEATDARRAFPCVDEPASKAIFDVTLIVPAHMTAISNTIPSSIEEHDSGFRLVQFAPTPKMSTYLLAFIVGEFDFIEKKTKEGVLIRVFVTPGKKEQARFALEVADKTLSFYNHYFQIPYPLPVLDLIAIPDFESGAMENWGAVTYRESALLVDPEHSSNQNKQWVALVIAHELAHQWFGNLVTMEWWTHLWLNEGFASYIEYLAVDHLFPEWDIWTQFVYLDLGRALELDGLKNTHPIEVDVHHPSEIEEIFDAVSYSKGASVIRMLASYLGETAFRDGLRHYLKTHQYKNARTEDLWLALEHVSRKPVRRLMQSWTRKPGYPLLAVYEEKKKLVIKQSRFYAHPKIKEMDSHAWPTPLLIEHNSKKKNYGLLEKKQIQLPLPTSWIKLNPEETAFYRVQYGASLLHRLKSPITTKKLKAVDRLGLVRDAFALVESGKMPTTEVLDLALAYEQEHDYTVWVNLTSHLTTLESLLFGEKPYEEFQSYGRKLYKKISRHVGWTERKGERHTETFLRPLVLGAAGSFGDESVIMQAKKLFKEHLRGKSISPNLRGIVYRLTAENGGEKEYEAFLKLFRAESLHEEKNRLMRALASFPNQKLINHSLKIALSSEVRYQDAPSFLAALWANPHGRELTWKFVQKNWQIIQKRYGHGHSLSRLLGQLAVFTDKKYIPEIKSFFKKHPAPNARRAIDQAIEQIEINHDWRTRDAKNIHTWLKELEKK